MEVIKQVPAGIRYISDWGWNNYNFKTFPSRCIVDKQITGCGYTEWALTCPYPVIIASPRKMLLQNKKDQHPEVLLVSNSDDSDPNVDIDLSNKPKSSGKKKLNEISKDLSDSLKFSNKTNFRNELYKQIKDYFEKEIDTLDNMFKTRISEKKFPKILVTYDSYYIVKGILEDLGKFNSFWTVVDEMQSILSDSRFKSDTELKFMKALEGVQKVQFISATPILGKYIQMLDEFKNIPYCKLDWETLDPSRVKRPEFEGILTMRSVSEKLCENIEKYKRGEFVSKFVLRPNGTRETVTSTEAVFYVNSVRHIISAIKKCELKPEEVNILCADTPNNIKRVKKLGKGFDIGTVPLQGEPRKMFTFCTRTVYLGADFYSDCARSFIFSDANSECLAADITQDLPQIFGRQRLVENPWKNCATIYYKTDSDYKKMSPEKLRALLDKKVHTSNELLEVYSNSTDSQKLELVGVYSDRIEALHYNKDYVSVTNGKAVFNTLAYVSEVRAFDIQKRDYADRFTVFSNLLSISSNDTKCFPLVANFLKDYQTIKGRTWERLRMVCEFYFNNGKDASNILLDNLQDVDPVKEIFLAAGPELCRSHSYRISEIKSLLGNRSFNMSDLNSRIYSEFMEGLSYVRTDLKNRLQEIFEESGYGVKAKATSIGEWFEYKSVTIDLNGKKINGFKLIKRKE